MIDLIVSFVLTIIISMLVKLYFRDSGLAAFPVLTFLVIAVASWMATSFVHSLFFR